MSSDRIVVTKNNDTSLLAKTFPEAMKAIAAATSTGTLFGEEAYDNEPSPEPFDYIPNPGISTYRGSRTVSSRNGRPWNSPADVVRQEVFSHTNLYTEGKIHPSIEHQKVQIQDNIGDPHLPPPPTQYNSIPPEFKNTISENDLAGLIQKQHTNHGGYEEMNINDLSRKHHHVSARPVPVITNSIPVASHSHHHKSHYDDNIPETHEHAAEFIRTPQYIPPAKPKDPPFQPTEDMILKINGYNERNMRLLGEVSKNITRCTEMISKLNDLTKPINVDEMMGLLEFMDNEAYRALFVQSFENLLNKNLDLHNKLTMYLSGNGPVSEDTIESSMEADPEPTTYPEGNVTITSSDENTTLEGDTQNDTSFQEPTIENP